MDYIYYVDELEKLHNQGIVLVDDIEKMRNSLPKLYRMVKMSEANAVSFYIIEGKQTPIGIVVLLYKDKPKSLADKAKIIMPSI
jgi:hypoxanthine phosphoribosyltransferase